MENYHLTKEESFRQDDMAINRFTDRLAETKSKLKEEILNLQLQNSILINALKEIAVPYPTMKSDLFSDEYLCKYLILTAQEALKSINMDAEIQKQKTEVNNLITKSKNL